MKNILEWLEKSAELYPGKVAFEDIEENITYKELMDDARSIASIVAAKTAPKNSIAVFMDKSVSAVEAFMGIAYAGCFYTLVDPSFPEERINQILDILGSKVVITDMKNESKIKNIVAKRNASYMMGLAVFSDVMSGAKKDGRTGPRSLTDVVSLSDYYLPKYSVDEDRLTSIREQISEDDALYCNFTSGSTGVPKGVLISHKAVITFIENFVETVGIGHKDVIGNQAPFDFDVSVKDIYSTLKCGATMVIIPKPYFMFPTKIMDLIEEHKVTTLIWAVSALVMVCRLKGLMYKSPQTIDKIMFSGETMSVKQLNEWKKYYPDATYINLYGPTEITCNCTYHILDKAYDIEDNIPMGSAFTHCQVYLVDEAGEVITLDKVGVSGEVCVSGDSLAIGYLNNETATKDVFKYEKYASERVYHTGDIAYYGEDGYMYFAGRADFQIKHMGHRIELEEIEKVLGGVDMVEQACCFYDPQKNKVIAYYVGDEDKGQIVERLKKKVPEYMVPNVYRRVESMPLNKNGKTDRTLLKRMYMDGSK